MIWPIFFAAPRRLCQKKNQRSVNICTRCKQCDWIFMQKFVLLEAHIWVCRAQFHFVVFVVVPETMKAVVKLCALICFTWISWPMYEMNWIFVYVFVLLSTHSIVWCGSCNIKKNVANRSELTKQTAQNERLEWARKIVILSSSSKIRSR